MAVSLVMIGLFIFVGFMAQQVSNWLRQRVGEVELFIDDRADERTIEMLQQRAGARPGVAEALFVSQEEAREIFRAEFGDEADVFSDTPFLPASIKIRVQPSYANPDSLQTLIADFGTWNRVDEVVFNQPLLVKVQQNLRLLTTIGLILGVVVVLAAIFLVANTIRLTIYARRLLIRTMKLVGATDRFIRGPFLVEGIVQGFIAGVLAAAMLWGIYRLMLVYLPQLELAAGIQLILFGLIIIGLGVMLGWVGSYFAAKRFIRRVSLH